MAFVDLGPLDALADDPPALELPEAPSDPRQADARRPDHRRREVDSLPALGHFVAADIEHEGSGRPSSRGVSPARLVVRPKDVSLGAGSSRHHRTAEPFPPADPPTQPSAPGTHPNGTTFACPGAAGRRVISELDEHDVLLEYTDVVLPRLPLQLHHPGRAQVATGVPFADAQEDPLAVIAPRTGPPSSPPFTQTRSSPPWEARRCTCDAMGTVDPPGGVAQIAPTNREYWEGRPDSGRASTEPACQNTPASASESRRRYETAFPSRSSTA